MEFFGLASLCWTVAISVHIHQVIFGWKWFCSKWSLLVTLCFGGPASVVLVAVGNGCFGHTSENIKSWCWIRVRDQSDTSKNNVCNGLVWMYYGPQVVGCVCCIILYIRASQRVETVLLGHIGSRERQSSQAADEDEDEDMHESKLREQVLCAVRLS
jgi:hypothetical protein